METTEIGNGEWPMCSVTERPITNLSSIISLKRNRNINSCMSTSHMYRYISSLFIYLRITSIIYFEIMTMTWCRSSERKAQNRHEYPLMNDAEGAGTAAVSWNCQVVCHYREPACHACTQQDERVCFTLHRRNIHTLPLTLSHLQRLREKAATPQPRHGGRDMFETD